MKIFHVRNTTNVARGAAAWRMKFLTSFKLFSGKKEEGKTQEKPSGKTNRKNGKTEKLLSHSDGSMAN
jgi:hypothetical protein